MEGTDVAYSVLDGGVYVFGEKVVRLLNLLLAYAQAIWR